MTHQDDFPDTFAPKAPKAPSESGTDGAAAPEVPPPLPEDDLTDDAAKLAAKREKDRQRKRRQRAKERQDAPPKKAKKTKPPPGPSMGGRKARETDPPKVETTESGDVHANLGALGDPAMLAGIMVVGFDAIAQEVGKVAFGANIGPTMGANPESMQMMTEASSAYLKSMDVTMTPGQMLVAAIAAAYLPNAMACMALVAEQKKQGIQFEADAKAQATVKDITPKPTTKADRANAKAA